MQINQTVNVRPLYELKKKGVLLVSPVLAAQIIALHKACGKREWSGALFFTAINEDLSNPENFLAEAEAVYPMHLGSGAYTEYEFDPMTVFDMYEKYPAADPTTVAGATWKLGHIHTHHDMGAFFSGTDNGELRDNAEKYVYYLSLVVDFKGTFCAKVAFIGQTQEKVAVTNSKTGLTREVTQPVREVFVTFDLDVKMKLDDWFNERVAQVVKDAKPESATWSHGDYYRGGAAAYSSGSTYQPGRTYPGPNGAAANQGAASTPNGTNARVGSSASTYTPTDSGVPRLIGQGSVTLKNKIQQAIRLLAIKNEAEAKQVSYWMVFDKIAETYPEEVQRDGWKGWVLNRFNSWFIDHFKVDYQDDIEKEAAIAYEILSQVSLHTYGSKLEFVKKFHATLQERLDKKYLPLLLNKKAAEAYKERQQTIGFVGHGSED